MKRRELIRHLVGHGRDLVTADQRQQSLLNRLRTSQELATQIDVGLQSDSGRHWTADIACEIKAAIIRQDQPDMTRE